MNPLSLNDGFNVFNLTIIWKSTQVTKVPSFIVILKMSICIKISKNIMEDLVKYWYSFSQWTISMYLKTWLYKVNNKTKAINIH